MNLDFKKETTKRHNRGQAVINTVGITDKKGYPHPYLHMNGDKRSKPKTLFR